MCQRFRLIVKKVTSSTVLSKDSLSMSIKKKNQSVIVAINLAEYVSNITWNLFLNCASYHFRTLSLLDWTIRDQTAMPSLLEVADNVGFEPIKCLEFCKESTNLENKFEK